MKKSQDPSGLVTNALDLWNKIFNSQTEKGQRYPRPFNILFKILDYITDIPALIILFATLASIVTPVIIGLITVFPIRLSLIFLANVLLSGQKETIEENGERFERPLQLNMRKANVLHMATTLYKSILTPLPQGIRAVPAVIFKIFTGIAACILIPAMAVLNALEAVIGIICTANLVSAVVAGLTAIAVAIAIKWSLLSLAGAPRSIADWARARKDRSPNAPDCELNQTEESPKKNVSQAPEPPAPTLYGPLFRLGETKPRVSPEALAEENVAAMPNPAISF